MALSDDFRKASEDVKFLTTRPSNENLLALYGLYKQATDGDVNGRKPGMLDLKGRKKYDAWESRKGLSADKAMREYIELATKLLKSSP